MLKNLSNWLYKISSGWVTLLGIVIFFAFTALVLPSQSAAAETYSQGVGSPDTSFFYTPNDLYTIAEAYGEAGREEYIRARFTFDLLWPVVYTLFLATTISWLFGRVLDPNSSWRIVNLIPVVGMAFDYLENVAAALVIWRYPATTPIVEWLTPIFTLLKWGFIIAGFLLLLIGLAVWAGNWLHAQILDSGKN